MAIKRVYSDDEKIKDGKKVPCEVFSRVCWYYNPVQTWNHGKRKEFAERRYYNPFFRSVTHA